MGNSTHAKNLCGKDSTSTLSHVKDQNSLSGQMKPDKHVSLSENNHALRLNVANADNKENKLLLADSDTISQPPLAVPKVLFSRNKNKTGSFDGVVTTASIVHDLCNDIENESYGDDSNVMNTDDYLLDLDRNFNLNTYFELSDNHKPTFDTEFAGDKQVTSRFHTLRSIKRIYRQTCMLGPPSGCTSSTLNGQTKWPLQLLGLQDTSYFQFQF